MTKVASAEATLVVRKTISATPHQVFEAFTDGAIMQQWMGPGDVRCISASCDARVGGSYRLHMVSEQGDHIAYGDYLEIDVDRKIVFTWSWESLEVKNTQVTVTFAEENGATVVELTHIKLPDQETANKHTFGWNGCLDKLANHFG